MGAGGVEAQPSHPHPGTRCPEVVAVWWSAPLRVRDTSQQMGHGKQGTRGDPSQGLTVCKKAAAAPWSLSRIVTCKTVVLGDPAACWHDAVQVSTGGEGSVGHNPMCPAQAWPAFHVLLHRAPHTGTVLTVEEERVDVPMRDGAGEVIERDTPGECSVCVQEEEGCEFTWCAQVLHVSDI